MVSQPPVQRLANLFIYNLQKFWTNTGVSAETEAYCNPLLQSMDSDPEVTDSLFEPGAQPRAE